MARVTIAGMALFDFELIVSDTSTSARRGSFRTPHGTVETPLFMPVGTRATVKGVLPDQLRSLLPFSRLNQEQLYFMLTFVRCEGRFNRMEDELSLSYPTLRGRLDEIIRALGFEPAREEAETVKTVEPAVRQEILDMLNRGEIGVEEARRRLRGEQPELTPANQPEE